MRRWHVPRRPNQPRSPVESTLAAHGALGWGSLAGGSEHSRNTVDIAAERLACSSRGESAPLATIYTPWPPRCIPSGAHTTALITGTSAIATAQRRYAPPALDDNVLGSSRPANEGAKKATSSRQETVDLPWSSALDMKSPNSAS